VPEAAVGKKVRCPECLAVHPVEDPIPVAEVVRAGPPRKPAPAAEFADEPAPRRKKVRAEVADAPPESKPAPAWKKKDDEDDEKPAQPPIPAWAWPFAGACGIIPILTLGGAIPAAIGFGGAGGCVGVARDATKPLALRVGICAGIVVVCWVLVIALVGGLALLADN
jgi:hypothetical protein